MKALTKILCCMLLAAMVAPMVFAEEKAIPEKTDIVIDGVSFISIDTLKKWMKEDKPPLIIDVLSEESYNKNHVDTAINIPFAKLKEKAAELDKERRTVVYCANYKCHASTAAAKVLTGLGFTDVHDYKGGINEWVALKDGDKAAAKEEAVKVSEEKAASHCAMGKDGKKDMSGSKCICPNCTPDKKCAKCAAAKDKMGKACDKVDAAMDKAADLKEEKAKEAVEDKAKDMIEKKAAEE